MSSETRAPTAETHHLIPRVEDKAIVAENHALVERVKALTISTKEEHERAQLLLVRLAAAAKKVESFFAVSKKLAHQTWKAICNQESQLATPLKQARQVASQKCAKYERDEEQARLAEQRRREEEARKAEEERRLREAVESEERGATETAEEILEEAPTPPPVTPPPEPKTAAVPGVSGRTTWKGEVTDLHKLVQHVAENPQWIRLLKPDMPAINKVASAMRDALDIAGIRAVPSTSHQVKGV